VEEIAAKGVIDKIITKLPILHRKGKSHRRNN